MLAMTASGRNYDQGRSAESQPILSRINSNLNTQLRSAVTAQIWYVSLSWFHIKECPPLGQQLSQQLSPEKTKVSTFNGGGFDFLGFHFSRTGISMRDKSMEKLKDKVRTLTTRSHNFSDEVIQKINRVTRGSANYFATDFSNVQTQFVKIDHMIRRRLRCMKKKRISASDNYRIPNRFFKRKGLVSLYELI